MKREDGWFGNCFVSIANTHPLFPLPPLPTQDDQLGVWDKNTARTFYAAGVFYDVMQQFKGLLGPEIEKKRKYCKWKATDILTALKEGRAPTQGGGGFAATAGGAEEGGGEEGGGLAPPSTAEAKSPTSASSPSLPPPPPPYSATLGGGGGVSSPTPASPPPSAASPASRPPPPYIAVAPPTPPPAAPAAPAPAAPVSASKPPTTTSSSGSSKGGVGVSSKQAVLDDAKELCYFAISAIQHKETALAIDRLEKALQKLKGL